MNWKKELEKKAKEFNLKPEKEVNNVSVRGSNGGNSNVSDRSRRVSPLQIPKKKKDSIKNKFSQKGGELMITRDAALGDLKKIKESVKDNPVARVVIEVAEVIVKILSTMRSNQLLTDEDKKEIKKRKAERKPKEEKKAE